MIRILKNKKGSALTYVLIIMMLLSILGLSLISSTVINFKINRQSNSFNKSFYITDGAIDETLAELREITYRAEADASNWISDPEADFRGELKWIKFFNNVNIRLESGELTSEEVVELTQAALERELTKKYYVFLLEVPNVIGVDSTEIYEEDYELYDDENIFVENNNIKLKQNIVLKPEYVTSLTEVKFAPAEATNFDSASIENIKLVTTIEDDYFSLNITSNGAYNDNKKVIEVELDVIMPIYNYIVSTTSPDRSVHKNEALTNAIIAREDIIIVDGKVTVNGDIYAYGTLPNVQEYFYSDVGGILIGVDKTNLNSIFTSIGAVNYKSMHDDEKVAGALVVDGEIQSRSSIRINGVGSTLNSTGDMYANSFVVDKNADDFIGSADRNLYIMEDMILFGDNSNIRIGTEDESTNGELWTFLEGSPSGTNKGVRDLSGSIILSKTNTDLKLITNNYFISGVAYIDLYRTISEGDSSYKSYYQSGESFTTNRYNHFYTETIASTDKSTKHFDYTVASGDYKDQTTKVVETVKDVLNPETLILETDVIQKDVNYKAIHFITKNDEATNKYGTVFNPISGEDKNLFTVNSLKTVNGNNNFARGVILGNEKIFNPYATVGSDPVTFVNMPDNDFSDRKNTSIEQLDKKVSLLATRNYTNGSNEKEKFDEIFNVNEDTAFSNLNDANNFVFINHIETKNIYLNIPSTQVDAIRKSDPGPTPAIVVSDSLMMTLNGAIITKGNIIIYNESDTDFVFNGPIISQKNILMYGSGEKIINSKSTDDGYSPQLFNAILANDNLFQATNSQIGKMVEVESVSGGSHLTRSINGNLVVNIIDNSETINPTSNSNVLLEGIIKTNEAKTIRINSWKEID